jgi:hypothetical protein
MSRVFYLQEFVNDYSNGHDYLIGDCLLAKLNLIEGKPRKNRMRKLSNVGSVQKEAKCQKRLS